MSELDMLTQILKTYSLKHITKENVQNDTIYIKSNLQKFMDTHMNGLHTNFIPVVTSGKEEEQKSLLKGIPTVSLVSNREKDLKKILHFYTCKLEVVRLPLNYSCFFMCD